MDNSDNIWKWCNARKRNCEGRLPMGRNNCVADGSRSRVSKASGRRRMNTSSVRRSKRISKENALKSRDSCSKPCLPVQSSSMEIDPFKNAADGDTNSAKSPTSVMREHVLSSDTNSDTVSNGPHHASVQGSSYFSIAGENSVQDLVFYQKLQRKSTKLKVWRRGQKETIKQDSACIDEGNNCSSWNFSACNGETSAETSSSCSISEVAEDVRLQSWTMNGQVRNPIPFGSSETSYSHRDWHRNHPNSKSSRGDQNLKSVACKRPYAARDQKDASEIALQGLHLLADTAIRVSENDQVHCPEHAEGRVSSEEWIKKGIFFLTGEPFLQRRVLRRARSAFKSKYEAQSPIVAYSNPLLAHNVIRKLSSAESVTQRESQASHQVAARTKRTRSQAMPSKYCDSVLQPWKRGTRR